MSTTVDTPSGLDGPRFVSTTAGELALCAPGAVVSPLVVDSWLVVDGAVRGLGLHLFRFRESCRALLPQLDRETLDGFLGQVLRALPREGRWFPRIEAHADPALQLVLWLRGAPKQEWRSRLWVSGEPDARTRPLVKGPDLAALAALRLKARRSGADDALLSDEDGTVLETAHSALVWWRDETLCMPDAEGAILPSVTRTLLVELARGRGASVVRERVPAVELRELEAWTLNALHGIRPVSALIGAGISQGMRVESLRVEQWSRALTELAAPIDDASASEARCELC
jgi:branched-subunit amino acid aminotransferase/4-amino-4-deoxychorismate lyase